MIDFYFHPSPNPMKVALLLAELEAPFTLVPVDIFKGDQHAPAFRKINPNGKVPAIVEDGVTLFDSHAILLYLADQHCKFVPTAGAARAATLSWLMFVGTGLSPFSGQAVHFLHYAPEVIPYARQRYLGEVERHYQVMDRQLASSPYLAGAAYTIADIALWGWASAAPYIFGEAGLAPFPHVARLVAEISARPAALRARQLREGLGLKTEVDAETRRALFGRLGGSPAQG